MPFADDCFGSDINWLYSINSGIFLFIIIFLGNNKMSRASTKYLHWFVHFLAIWADLLILQSGFY